MKYASVCSGVEAASLAWMPLGWEAAWFSEIEPFPCAVLKKRFPNVPNLGDMTKIKVENLENGDQRFTNGNGTDVIVPGGVDLLVGGTPCQSFSVAGKREGLDGASGLAKTFVELLYAMRPRWFVWENVPGCLSSRDKRTGIYDFNFLLSAFTGGGYSCSWRILDAQYVRVDGFPRAVPQRRRRVFVVGHLGDEWEYPAEVLFEQTGMFGDNPPCRIKGKGFTTDVERSVGTASRPWDSSGVNPTLTQCGAANGTPGSSNQELFAQNFNGLVMNTFASSSHGRFTTTGGTLKSSGGDVGGGSENLAIFWNGESVCTTLTEAFADDRMPDKGKLPCVITPNGENVADTLDASYYKGVGNRNSKERTVVCLNDQGGSVMQIEQNGNAGTLRANTHGNEQIVCVHGSQDPCCNSDHTNSVQLNNGLENVVCYAASGFGQKVESDVSATISTDHDDRVTGNNAAWIMGCFQQNARNEVRYINGDGAIAGALSAEPGMKQTNYISVAIAENIIGRQVQNGGNGTGAQEELAYTQNASGVMGVANHATVRRLLPIETERLMGFPDNHTRIPWKGKPAEECPDSPRYKACGNSMCVNVMRWIGMRIELTERKANSIKNKDKKK